MGTSDNRKTRKLYADMLSSNFNENDWMVTVRLRGIDDKEKFISDHLNKLLRKTYPNRKFRSENECALRTFAVIGWTNKEGLSHSAAHILIQDFDYRSQSVGSFQELLYKVFRKNRTLPGDVDVRRIFDVAGASNYVLFEQGDDVTILNTAMKLQFEETL